MTREQLEDYHNIVVRIKTLQTEIVTDSVKGSSDEYPYTSHSITLHGIRRDGEARKEMKLLEQKKKAIDGYIDGIEDVRAKALLDMKCRKDWSWNRIAAKTGRSDFSERKYLSRFFRENL